MAISFTAGQFAKSKSVALNDGTITKATLTSTEASGSFDYGMKVVDSSLTPLIHLKMNDDLATTAVIDSVGTYAGTASFNTDDNSVAGKMGTALNFPLSTDKIDLDSSKTFTGEFTFACWVNKATFGNHGICGDQTSFNNGRFSIVNSTTVSIYVSDGIGGNNSQSVNLSSTMPTSEWFHLVFKRDSSDNLFVYLNGVDVTAASYTRSGDINIGRIADNPTDSSWVSLTGYMDDFRMYESALSQADIDLIYAEGDGKPFTDSYFEEVTSATSHTFANSGTDLKWIAEENAASTGEINNIKIEYE